MCWCDRHSSIAYAEWNWTDWSLKDMPAVGRNLQDHLEIYVQQRCTKPITLHNQSSWRYPHNMIRIGAQWFLNQTGLAASSHLETGGFVRSNEKVEHPDSPISLLAFNCSS